MPVELVSNRNFTFRSTLGHTVRFEKDKPKLVPSEIAGECARYGAIPTEDQPSVRGASTNTPSTTEERADNTPKTPEERKERIQDAMLSMLSKNDRNDFTAGGKPHQKRLSALVGFDVDVTERDQLWAEVREVGDD